MKNKDTNKLTRVAMLLLGALFSLTGARAQETLFSENFESGAMPTGWTTDGPGTWRVGTGDYYSSTGAGQGDYNALITHGTTSNVTKLITPEIDLSSVTNAELSFMYVLRSWSGDTDELKVYYRTSSSADWTLLEEYTAAVTAWTTVKDIMLPKLSSTYQLAFEMTDNYGYGVGIDDIKVINGGSVAKPTGLEVLYQSGTEATVRWTSTESAFDIEVNGVETSNITTNTYILTNLQYATTYSVRVRAKKNGEVSNWTDPVTFRTASSANSFIINYSLADSYGDGWNGNAINIVDGDGNIIQSLTIDSGYSNSGILELENGTYYKFVWVKGSYPSECSFTFTDSGGKVLFSATSTQASNLADGAILYVIDPFTVPRPTDLAASHVTATSANISWTGNADSYNLRYVQAEAKSQDFEESSLGEWTTIDADGDGYGWVLGSNVGGVYLKEGSSLAGNGYNDSQDLIVSGSFSNVDGVGALTPDNYLVSPKVKLGGSISFWAKGQDANYPSEVFGVAVSTTDNTNASSFTMVGADKTATGEWTQYTFDLSAYSGEGYVAIRHYNVTDMFLLDIDDIVILEPGDNWTEIPGITANSYELTSLTPEASYQVQVQAVLGDGESNWTSPVTFTTTSTTAAPTDLATTDVKATSATLDWAGSQESYNLQYREALPIDPTAPATIIFTADDVWGDGSGYQMLLDADATAYGTIIPETGALTTSGDASAETYAEFEYKIPENADGALTTVNIVADNSIIIQIPAGTYDWCITNPTPGDRMWIAGGNGNVGGRYDNYVFEAGKTYEFHVYLGGSNDATDVTITRPMSEWTVVENVTAPYELTGLIPETYYEWQVQGNLTEGTTEWSLSSFTTLDAEIIPLADNADNTELIDAFNGQTVDVQLAGRTLYKDGSWNTICLPFDVTIAGSPLDGATVMELNTTSSSLNESTLTLNFTEVTTIDAGKPYLIKWASGTNLTEEDLVFNGVEIKKDLVPAVVGSNVITFSGNYAPVPFEAGDKNILYVGANNQLYYPNAEVTMNAFRAYFKLDDSSLIKHFALKFSGDDATGISTVEAGNGNETIYNVAGMRLNKAQKGVNIVNGKKVLF